MIDKSSPEFMFGQILVRLDTSDKIIGECKSQVLVLAEAVNRLPCSRNDERITDLEKWESKQNSKTIFKAQSIITFKHALIVGLIIAAFSSVMTFLITSL